MFSSVLTALGTALAIFASAALPTLPVAAGQGPNPASAARLHASAHSRVAAISTAPIAPRPTAAATPPPQLTVPGTPAPVAAPRSNAPVPVTTRVEPVAAAAASTGSAAIASPAPVVTSEMPDVIVVTERAVGSPVYLLPYLLAVLAALALLAAVLGLRRRRRWLEVEAFERAKLDFLLLSSHELRTPLSVASGYVAMAADGSLGELSPGLSSALPTVSEKLEDVESMLDRMLLAVQASFGRVPLRIETIGARGLVAAATEHAVRSGRPRGRFQFVGELDALILADRNQAPAALGALLDNAAKFSAPSTVVTCRVHRRRLRRTVEFEVADAGSGLDKAARTVLFARFGRRPTPADSHVPGAGLGLYVARELARAQGGEVRLRSTSEHGSNFVLSLPAA